MTESYRLGILATHPVQYHAPWFRHLASRVSLSVFYAHQQSPQEQADAGFDEAFEWDSNLLEGYAYHWLRNSRWQHPRSRFLRFNLPDIEEIVRDGGFSAFLIFGWNYLGAWQACRACLRHRVPVFMRGDSLLANYRTPIKRFIKRAVYPYGLGRFTAHLYVGIQNREYLLRYGVPDRKLYFVPHCVDGAYFKKQSETAESSGVCTSIRARLEIPEDAFVFVFAGKLIDEKRPSDFLEGMARHLRTQEGRNAYAIIVGSGPLRASLERSAQSLGNRVRFAGFVNQSEMAAYYRAADALVLTSERESWGLVVNEAAECGRPAIVSDSVGCAPDLIDNRFTGFVYPTADCAQLAARMSSMRKACRDERTNVRRALQQNCQRYSIPNATDGLISAIHDTAAAQ